MKLREPVVARPVGHLTFGSPTSNLGYGDLLQNPSVEISIAAIQPGSIGEPRAPSLASAEIHVWEIPLLVSELAFAHCANLLSSEEHTRASRFHFEKDARRFTVARGCVRSILAGYALLPASDLRFIYAQHGKPSLAQAAIDIRFSVSHSGDMALLGVALEREVGVDIEAVREDIETDKLAERFFSVHERESLRLLPLEQRVPSFFRCWSCKEAFLKAQGVGLSRPLGSFDVDTNPGQAARLLSTRPDPSEAARWSLYKVETAPGYAAAAAVEGSITAMTILRSRQT